MLPEASRKTLARRLSAALCLALVSVFAWAAYRQTAGFDTWTFEGRRQLLVANGELRAPTVAMNQAFGYAVLQWPSGAATPAAYLVDFIYVRCPSVCRSLGSQYQQMQRQLQNDPALARVQLASISFDVAHDGRAELRQLASSLGAEATRWSFAVPASDGDAYKLLRALGVVAIDDGAGGFVHNGDIHLLDRQGRLRGLFAVDEWTQALAAAGRLAQQAQVQVQVQAAAP
ncbi:MAG: SCO family protein [Burkholderiaceae bacterium]